MIVVVARHEVRPEHAAAFPRQLRDFTDASRREAGVISFDWARSAEDPSVCFLIEVFRDAAAAEAHVKSDNFRQAIEVLPTLVEAPPEIIHIAGAGDGWGRMAEVNGKAD